MPRPLRTCLIPALLTIIGTGLPALAAGSVRVQVSPNVLLADGASTAIVTADVRGRDGRPVRDGTEVRFYTTAGSITSAAFTSAGVARATLQASDIPSTANISVSVGLDQAVVTVPMVSKLVEASVGGRVMRVEAKYVAFSEDKQFIQADEQVLIRYRAVRLEANSVQVDLNGQTLKALGKVLIAADDKSLAGERLWLDLKTFEGYIQAVGTRRWFSAYGLTELPERPKNLNPDFDLVDLTDSKLIWVGKSANYISGERVQMQGARAYVGGLKSIRVPFHETRLNESFGGTDRYLGVGSEGISLDVPLYLQMTPGASTALRVGYGARSGGIGYFTRERGLSIDLVEKYGFRGAAEGEASLTNLSSPDRLGFYWSHIHQLNRTTRLVTGLQFPEHRDLYGQFNLTSGLPIGTLQLAMTGSRPERTGRLASTLAFNFETKPRPVADGRVALSVTSSFYRREAQQTVISPTPTGIRRIPVPAAQYQAVGIKARPRSISIARGLSLDSSASLQAVSGGARSGFGPSLETHLRQQLPNNGHLTFGINYNRLTQVTDFLPSQGRLNATFSASYPVNSRLRLTALGSAALDAETRHSLLMLSYQFSKTWRLDALHTLFEFGTFGDTDYQFGLARPFGDRELGLYWSRREHKLILEFGSSRF